MRLFVYIKKKNGSPPETRERIINFLKEHDKSTYGEIIKNLSLSAKSGMKVINELKNEGIISNTILPPFYQLNKDDR